MAETDREPTEKTLKGFKVRIPKRREFFSNLKKIAKKPAKDSTPRSSQK
jgi:hypothetical protein